MLELRPLLRDAAVSDDHILSQIATAVRGKKFAHNGSSSARLQLSRAPADLTGPSALAAERNQPMVRIGG